MRIRARHEERGMMGFDMRFIEVTPNEATGRVLLERAQLGPELDDRTIADLVERTRAFPAEMLWSTPGALRTRPAIAPLVKSLWLRGEASEREVLETLVLTRWTHARIHAPNDTCLRDALASLPASVRAITIAGSEVSLDAMLAVLARPSLEALSFELTNFDVAKALHQQKELPRLRHLHLRWTDSTADGGRLLARDELADLESFSIHVRDHGMIGLGKALAAHRRLRALSIDVRHCLDPKASTKLIAALPGTIEELELDVPYDEDGLVSAAVAARGTPFRAFSVPSPTFERIDLRAPVFASLERLTLRGPQLGDPVVEALIDRAPPLVQLDLGTCGIGPEGSMALARSRLLDRVERLSLANNAIDPRVPLALVERPGFVDRIVTLDLSSCSIPAPTVDRLLAALADAPRLAEAKVAWGNEFSTDAIAVLRALEDAHVQVGTVPYLPTARPAGGAATDRAGARAVEAPRRGALRREDRARGSGLLDFANPAGPTIRHMIDVKDRIVVLTGTFTGVKRAVAEAGLAAKGATVAGSVTKKTSLVFAGADPGSKLEKARALGIPVHDEAALLAVLTGEERSSHAPSSHRFHDGFDRLVRELEAHPRVHIACVWRGVPCDPASLVPHFVARFGIAPGDDVLSFYAARNGCALIWMAKDDPLFDPVRLARRDEPPFGRIYRDFVDPSMFLIAMPPIEQVLGPDALDYAAQYHVDPGDPLDRYARNFIGFDFPGDYYTPAFVVERGRVEVQVGDDHGVFDDGRPTVPFDLYVDAVIATKGSIEWRNELFGFAPSTPRFLEAKRDPRAFLANDAPTIDELLPPTPAETAREEARASALAAAMPTDPRLRALIEAGETASSVSVEDQKDGRSLVRVQRADGGRQLAFLTRDERAAFEHALETRRALRS
jgi:hypothetical protein